MSYFRRPDESTSPSEKSDGGHTPDQLGYGDYNQHGAVSGGEDVPLTRIQTIDSASSAVQEPLPQGPVPATKISDGKDLIIHSILEDHCYREAQDELGKERNDPKVQELAQAKYSYFSRLLELNLDVSPEFAEEHMRQSRAAVQKAFKAIVQQSRIQGPSIPAGESGALVPSSASHANLIKSFKALSMDTGIAAIPSSIRSLMREHPGLNTHRYNQDFIEIGMIGKGGFGKVFKVMHRLDQSHYAVKQIMVSPVRLRKVQERGKEELDSILEEVRTLARLDHPGIARYHNAWLEYDNGTASTSSMVAIPEDRMIEAGSLATASQSDIDPFNKTSLTRPATPSIRDLSGGVVFQYSDSGADPGEASEGDVKDSSSSGVTMAMKDRDRRPSQGTASSARSKKSRVESAGSDDDAEIIPRSSHTYSPMSTSAYDQELLSQSDLPGSRRQHTLPGPSLIINIQMTLYDTNLAMFLSPKSDDIKQSSSPSVDGEHMLPRHCFHPQIALQIMQKILKGVEYLHSAGVLHRDLKPANVFLTVSRAKMQPSVSVNLTSCPGCNYKYKEDSLYVCPRIGDFGLVTALAEVDAVPVPARGVGTAFYRPSVPSIATDKLDVFALGIILFELLYEFGTRSERYATLEALRQGQFPSNFASDLGSGGKEIKRCIKDMLCAEESERLTCKEAKARIAMILSNFLSSN